jgi:hypothetical protein
MTWLDRLFGGTKHDDGATHVCRHPSLTPMWENVEEMGDPDKVTRYRCRECSEFLPLSAGRDRAHAAV